MERRRVRQKGRSNLCDCPLRNEKRKNGVAGGERERNVKLGKSRQDPEGRKRGRRETRQGEKMVEKAEGGKGGSFISTKASRGESSQDRRRKYIAG